MSEAPLVDRLRSRLLVESRSSDIGGVDLTSLVRDESSVLADDVALRALTREVEASLTGLGPLDGLLAIPGVTDVLVNGADEVWLDRGNGLERVAAGFADDAAVRQCAQRIAARVGRRLDDASPFVDARLPDGTRLHAVLPPISPRPCLSLRVLRRGNDSLESLVPAQVVPLLAAVIHARMSFVISGSTGAGKTTLLAAMLGCVSASERIVIVEDSAELVVAHPHVVCLQTRTPNVEGAGVVALRELVRQSLRMRPDRLVVGEFRGAEMLELLLALNTGHDGGAATLHANSAADVPARFAALAALCGVGSDAVAVQAAAAFDIVIHLHRRGGIRAVETVALLDLRDAALRVRPIWSLDPVTSAVDVEAQAEFSRRLAQRGELLNRPAVGMS